MCRSSHSLIRPAFSQASRRNMVALFGTVQSYFMPIQKLQFPRYALSPVRQYGGAYVVMSSKYLGTDVTYAWPSAEIAVLGAEGAANILFKKQIDSADDPSAERKKLANEYRERFNNPYYAAGTGYVDNIIEPRESRQKIIAALS